MKQSGWGKKKREAAVQPAPTLADLAGEVVEPVQSVQVQREKGPLDCPECERPRNHAGPHGKA